ncbi:MAG: hypothetical protein ACUVUC_08410 [Thermoguttaceae bacterium]
MKRLPERLVRLPTEICGIGPPPARVDRPHEQTTRPSRRHAVPPRRGMANLLELIRSFGRS